MRHHAYRPYRPDYDGTFATDEEPEDFHYISTRQIDGYWRVVSLEPGHCEHLHEERFKSQWDAIRLAQSIRRGLKSGLQLNLDHWETRAL